MPNRGLRAVENCRLLYSHRRRQILVDPRIKLPAEGKVEHELRFYSIYRREQKMLIPIE